MAPDPRRRSSDKRWVRFDTTVNLPLVLTLIVGFVSMITAVVQGYYAQDSRITRLEIGQSNIDKNEVVLKQGVILEKVSSLDRQMTEQKQRLDRIEEKLDRINERRVR